MSDPDAIVRSIDEEIERLQRARALMTGHTPPLKRGMPRTKQSVAAPLERIVGGKKDVVAEHTATSVKLKEQESAS